MYVSSAHSRAPCRLAGGLIARACFHRAKSAATLGATHTLPSPMSAPISTQAASCRALRRAKAALSGDPQGTESSCCAWLKTSSSRAVGTPSGLSGTTDTSAASAQRCPCREQNTAGASTVCSLLSSDMVMRTTECNRNSHVACWLGTERASCRIHCAACVRTTVDDDPSRCRRDSNTRSLT
jgi:hypothetical protein